MKGRVVPATQVIRAHAGAEFSHGLGMQRPSAKQTVRDADA